MGIKIDKKITAYSLVTPESKEEKAKAAEAAEKAAKTNVVQMGEPLSRPEELVGSTYKIKTPVTEHALYITINDIIMNEGTPQEHRRPFEVFINSKNMEHFQWIVALTRVMSAVFRKGGDVTFLVEELKSVFEPSGGYFKKGMNDEGFPKGATLCKKCNTKASIIMDGCLTCLNCGESKCG